MVNQRTDDAAAQIKQAGNDNGDQNHHDNLKPGAAPVVILIIIAVVFILVVAIVLVLFFPAAAAAGNVFLLAVIVLPAGTPAFIGRLLPAVQRTGRIRFLGSARQAAAAAFIALGLSGLAGIGFLLAKRAAFISVCIFFATNRALFQSHGGRPLLLISRSLSCAFLAVALSTSY